MNFKELKLNLFRSQEYWGGDKSPPGPSPGAGPPAQQLHREAKAERNNRREGTRVKGTLRHVNIDDRKEEGDEGLRECIRKRRRKSVEGGEREKEREGAEGRKGKV